METLINHWKKIAGGGLLATGFAASMTYISRGVWQGVWAAVAVMLLVLLLAFAGWIFYRRYWSRRRRKNLEEAVPKTEFGYKAVSGAEAEGVTEEMKFAVRDGVEKMRDLGMDLYELPWYLVMGYSSSGKSFVCQSLARRIGTPEGMNKPYRDNLEGTYNMEWWFYNDAVFIDTAGRIAFQESPEWPTMLENLRKARKDCPINGVFLVVGADELAKESDEELFSRAKKLREQLDRAKLKLQVRFPVYVLVTKGDLIDGFAEFFKDLPTQDKRDQIIGWSNNGDLDSTVIRVTDDTLDAADRGPDPDYFDAIFGPLKRWRMSVMGAPETGGHAVSGGQDVNHRLNNVDDGYGFPTALRKTMRRLDLIYLQTIFGDRDHLASVNGGESDDAAPRPRSAPSAYTRHRTKMRPFLRGVYLSSSRQGAPVNFDEEDRVDRIESRSLRPSTDRRIYFLKDLVLKKIFPERELVTPDESLSLGRKRLVLTASISVTCALLMALVLSLTAASMLRESIGNEERLWRTGAEPTRLNDGDLVSKIQNPQPMDGHSSLLEFHEKLAVAASRGVDVPWIFWPTKLLPFENIDAYRRDAQPLLFERQIARPLLNEARRKLSSDETRITAQILRPSLLNFVKFESLERAVVPRPDVLLQSALSILDIGSENVVRSVTNLGARAYQNTWPAARLSERPDPKEGLSARPGISGGIDKWFKEIATNATQLKTQQRAATALDAELKKLSDAEAGLYTVSNGSPLSDQLTRLKEIKRSVDAKLDQVELRGLTNGAGLHDEKNGLFAKITGDIESSSKAAVEDFSREIPDANGKTGLFAEIRSEIDKRVKGVAQSIGTSVRPNDANKRDANKKIDDGYLARTEDGRYVYWKRMGMIEKVEHEKAIFSFGTGFTNYFQIRQSIDAMKSAASSPNDTSQALAEKLFGQFLSRSNWEKALGQRWKSEYEAKKPNAESRRLVDDLRQLVTTQRSLLLNDLVRYFESFIRVEVGWTHATSDVRAWQANRSKFEPFQDSYLQTLDEELKAFGVAVDGNMVELANQFVGATRNSKLRYPLGAGDADWGFDIEEQVKAYAAISNSVAGNPQAFGRSDQKIGEKLAGISAALQFLQKPDGTWRQCSIEFDSASEAKLSFAISHAAVVFDTGGTRRTVAFNAVSNPGDQKLFGISSDLRVEARNAAGGLVPAWPDRTANSAGFGVLKLLKLADSSGLRRIGDSLHFVHKFNDERGRSVPLPLKVTFHEAGPLLDHWCKQTGLIK